MINPYGVQREYGLWLEDVERRDGQARGLVHEVGRARRHKEAAKAELHRSLVAASPGHRGLHGSARSGLLGLLGRPWLRLRRLRKTYA